MVIKQREKTQFVYTNVTADSANRLDALHKKLKKQGYNLRKYDLWDMALELLENKVKRDKGVK